MLVSVHCFAEVFKREFGKTPGLIRVTSARRAILYGDQGPRSESFPAGAPAFAKALRDIRAGCRIEKEKILKTLRRLDKDRPFPKANIRLA